VTAALSNVALEQASFLVAIETLRSGQEELCTAEGIDSVEFLLAANPGEPQGRWQSRIWRRAFQIDVGFAYNRRKGTQIRRAQRNACLR
jgi:hypothetical protein